MNKVEVQLAVLIVIISYTVRGIMSWPDFWVSVEFLHASIPRKGSCSFTTTRYNVVRSMLSCDPSTWAKGYQIPFVNVKFSKSG